MTMPSTRSRARLSRHLEQGLQGPVPLAAQCRAAWRSDPRTRLLSGEDLTCQAGLAVQQDTLLAASLGITHIERNGHHYVDGFGVAPAGGSARFRAGARRPLRRLVAAVRGSRVRDGLLDLRSLHVPGFASAAMPLWDSLHPHRLTHGETFDGHTNPRTHHARRHRAHGHEPAPDPLDRRDPRPGRRAARATATA